MPTSKSLKSIFVIILIIKNPTIIKAGAVTGYLYTPSAISTPPPTTAISGAKKIESKNKKPVVVGIIPVLPPSETPEALSI